MTTGPLTLYFDHKGYHGSHVQRDSKLLDAARQRSIAVCYLMATWMTPKTVPSVVVSDQVWVCRMQNLRFI